MRETHCFFCFGAQVPLAVLLAVRPVPPEVMDEHRAAALAAGGRLVSRAVAALVVALLALAAAAALWEPWRSPRGEAGRRGLRR